MPRPRHCFCGRIKFDPEVTSFKPQGVPMRDLETIELSLEELESFRLKNVEDLDQKQAAAKIGASVSTYQRLLYSAYKKVATALTTGKAIRVIKHE